MRVVHVVDHDQIQPSIPIVIKERSRHAPVRIVESSLTRDLHKLAAALIVKETDLVELRDEHVLLSIIVHVADGDAHPATLLIQSAARTDILETSIGSLMHQLMP